MQLDPCFVIHSVFHDAEKSLVCALADDDCLSDQLVATEASRGRHRPRAAVCASVQSWVQATEILSLRSSALGGHSKNACAADDEDTLVIDQLAVLDKQCTPVDVEDLALSVLTAVLLDIVVVANFRPIAVCSHGVPISACHLRDLCVEKRAHITLLVHNLQDLTIDSDNATNG